MNLFYGDRHLSARNRENARIAFSGPGGSGKTTLSRRLSKKLDSPHIHELIRTVGKEMGIRGINDLTRDERIMLQTLIAIRQKDLENFHQQSGFVSDRSLMCAKAYFEVFFGPSVAYDSLAQTQGYDLVILVPSFGIRPEDGFRLTNVGWEEKAESIMRQIPEIHVLQGITIDERWSEVLDTVDRRFPA